MGLRDTLAAMVQGHASIRNAKTRTAALIDGITGQTRRIYESDLPTEINIIIHPPAYTRGASHPYRSRVEASVVYSRYPIMNYDWSSLGGIVEEGQGTPQAFIKWESHGPKRVIVSAADTRGRSANFYADAVFEDQTPLEDALRIFSIAVDAPDRATRKANAYANVVTNSGEVLSYAWFINNAQVSTLKDPILSFAQEGDNAVRCDIVLSNGYATSRSASAYIPRTGVWNGNTTSTYAYTQDGLRATITVQPSYTSSVGSITRYAYSVTSEAVTRNYIGGTPFTIPETFSINAPVDINIEMQDSEGNLYSVSTTVTVPTRPSVLSEPTVERSSDADTREYQIKSRSSYVPSAPERLVYTSSITYDNDAASKNQVFPAVYYDVPAGQKVPLASHNTDFTGNESSPFTFDVSLSRVNGDGGVDLLDTRSTRYVPGNQLGPANATLLVSIGDVVEDEYENVARKVYFRLNMDRVPGEEYVTVFFLNNISTYAVNVPPIGEDTEFYGRTHNGPFTEMVSYTVTSRTGSLVIDRPDRRIEVSANIMKKNPDGSLSPVRTVKADAVQVGTRNMPFLIARRPKAGQGSEDSAQCGFTGTEHNTRYSAKLYIKDSDGFETLLATSPKIIGNESVRRVQLISQNWAKNTRLFESNVVLRAEMTIENLNPNDNSQVIGATTENIYMTLLPDEQRGMTYRTIKIINGENNDPGVVSVNTNLYDIQPQVVTNGKPISNINRGDIPYVEY